MAEEVKQEAASAAAPATEKKAPVKVEIPMNCGSCKKPISKKVRYYREMKYFCNKKCWAKYNAEKKQKEQPETPAGA